MTEDEVDIWLESLSIRARPYLLYVAKVSEAGVKHSDEQSLEEHIRMGRDARETLQKLQWVIETTLAADESELRGMRGDRAARAAERRRLDKLAARMRKQTLQAAERIAQSKPRLCSHEGCSRSAVFGMGGVGWCKRHVPDELRPRGKVT